MCACLLVWLICVFALMFVCFWDCLIVCVFARLSRSLVCVFGRLFVGLLFWRCFFCSFHGLLALCFASVFVFVGLSM